MFFQGSLQEGIAAALSQSKLVLCFVTDDEGESRLWETVYLRDGALAPLIERKTVPLRLLAGSEEAGYLAAIFPLPKTPTIVIIKNGDLKEYIAAGIPVEEFNRRLIAALSEGEGSTVMSRADRRAGYVYPSESRGRQPNGPRANEGSEHAATATDEDQSETSAEPDTHPAVAQILAERAARLTAERDEAAAEEKRKREIARGKKKAEREAKEGGEGAGLSASETKKHADLIRRKKAEEADARKRIQKMIEDDKAARRAEKALRAAEREMERKAALGIAADEESTEIANAGLKPTLSQIRDQPSITESCALQVRLLDGTSLKQRFPSGDSLKEVRSWIDQNRQDGTHPYTFKLMLSPLPSRTFELTEEAESLAALGLCPSATLVLLPIDKYSVAYAEATGGPFARLLAYIMAFLTWISTTMSRMFSAILPKSRNPDNSDPQPNFGMAQPIQAQATGRDQKERQKDYQLYNGNSLNFEPRKEDEDEHAI